MLHSTHFNIDIYYIHTAERGLANYEQLVHIVLNSSIQFQFDITVHFGELPNVLCTFPWLTASSTKKKEHQFHPNSPAFSCYHK